MQLIKRASHFQALGLSLSLIVISLPRISCGDDLTGLPRNDPKDLEPVTPTTFQPASTGQFVSMPVWSRNIVMPPLPYQLTPMGKKPASAVASATPAKEEPAVSTPGVPTDANGKPKPPPENPAMVTVSPFLQWIKSNPQAAAAMARQQAGAYGGAPVSAPGANTPTGPVNGEDPYWLPPLIDSAGSVPTGGSSAIYSQPQR